MLVTRNGKSIIIITIIIINSSSSSSSSSNVIFNFTFDFLQSFTQDGEGSFWFNVFLFFTASFGWHFFSHIDRNLQKRWSIRESAFICISYKLEPAKFFVDMFICPFLDHTQCSHYYWHHGNFKLPHVLDFNFKVFVYNNILWLICYYLLILPYQLEGVFFFYSP